MAQTNFTPILTYKSDTATVVPSAGNLTNSANGAELAVNTADKRLFTKDSGGNVVELGTNPSSLTLPNSTANGVVYANGSKVLTTGSALTFDGTNLGIGVTPAVPLEVQSDSGATGIRIRGRASANSGALRYFTNNGATQLARIEASDNAFEIGGIANIPITFLQNSSEQMRLTSTGLGIGTSSPAYKLDVTGTFRTTGIAYLGDATTTLIASIGNSGSSGVKIVQFQRATGTGDNVNIQGINTGVGAADIGMQVSGGNLGIGTSSPAYKLTVKSASDQIHITTPTAGDGVGDGFTLGMTGTTTQFIQRENAPIIFYTNSTDRLTLDASGNLGLGVTPSAWGAYKPYQVGWGALASTSATQNTLLSSNVYFDGSTFRYIGTSTASYLQQFDGAFIWKTAASGTAGNAISFSQVMTLTAAGNLGIGTSSPSVKLQVQGSAGSNPELRCLDGTVNSQWYAGSDGTCVFGTYSNHPIVWRTNGSERARIDSSGNLGIGTSSPGMKLDVAGGDIRITSASAPSLYVNNTSASGKNYRLISADSGNLIIQNTGIADLVYLNTAGNLGLGVTPSAWNSTRQPIQFSNGAGIFGNKTFPYTSVFTNTFNNTSDVWTYVTSGEAASRYDQIAGQHRFFTAPSGTAGDAISFSQVMTLDASGNLLVGSTTNTPGLKLLASDGTVSTGFLPYGGGSIAYTGTWTNHAFGFATNGTERARIDSSGNLIQTVNTTAATLATNNTLTFSIVDNSTLRISVRGSDGTTRTATVALT